MATQRLQIYHCPHCGNTIEVIRAGGGELVCCGEPMRLLTENTTDAATEKHVPVVEKVAGGVNVKVGEVDHPMIGNHFIEWIELLSGNKILREYLAPGQLPEATFLINAGTVAARAYCNLHGLWRSE